MDGYRPSLEQHGPIILPGYDAQPMESGVLHSIQKLDKSATQLQQWLPAGVELKLFPCVIEDDSWGYRCRCTFQLVIDEDGIFHYAMRHQKQPVLIGADFFPIASSRIQIAMKAMLEKVLNATDDFSYLKLHLTSATFSSAWHDRPESDCIITLHYEQPSDSEVWIQQAKIVCRILRLRQIYGRSRKIILHGVDGSIQSIRDTVWIHTIVSSDGGVVWDAALGLGEVPNAIPVYYDKPETAFYHPNSRAMIKALTWMLNRLEWIVRVDKHPCKLLEMYCGCGAHTVALAKTGLLEQIIAVELDQRLVKACEVNVQLNNLQGIVEVTQGDAGQWAKRLQKNPTINFDIILVDPPRMGLDEHVCRMVCQQNFKHLIYVSCGHEALIRDLERLSSNFLVIDCVQIDLFPRTDSIETLVHLERRIGEK